MCPHSGTQLASQEIIIGSSIPITIEDIERISRQTVSIQLNQDPIFIEKIKDGAGLVQNMISSGRIFYGVNTGLGDSCTTPISDELIAAFPANVITFLGVGMGQMFSNEQTRAIMASRLISLAQGYSGVRIELLQQLTALLNHDILPRIPQEGSVGASGDLAPLSYIGAALCGQRDVSFQNQIMPASLALTQVGLTPLILFPKEGLAIVNGTSAMTGVACLAWARANRLCQLATRLTSLTILGLKGNMFHYDAILFSVKPHIGQQRVAARIRSDLLISDTTPTPYPTKVVRIEDRYSTRCAPHVIGVLEDSLPFFRQLIENELNSANCNPIVDVVSQHVFHGGGFYGGHIAFAMDGLKTLVASVADLMDRQIAVLVDPAFNNGLPPNLSGMTGPSSAIHHGLKGIGIAASAWTAEALKQTMPASSFSRSTECHNQDKVSMGTIAARDCVRILDLTEQVAAALIITIRQALSLRMKAEGTTMTQLNVSKNTKEFIRVMETEIDFMVQDVFLEPILRKVVAKIQDENFWPLY